MRSRTARCRIRNCSSRGDTAFKAGPDIVFRQFAADEDKPALARLAVLPFALVITLQHHVHTLKHVAVVIAGEGENAFRAQDLLALGRDQVLQPRHEFRGIERLVGAKRQRLHLLVVIVLQPMAVAVIMVMMVVAMMVVIMVMVVI